MFTIRPMRLKRHFVEIFTNGHLHCMGNYMGCHVASKAWIPEISSYFSMVRFDYLYWFEIFENN